MALTQIQIDKFNNEGYLVIPDVFSKEELLLLRKEAEYIKHMVINSSLALNQKNPRLMWWMLPSGELYLFKIKPILDLSLTLYQIANESRIIDVMGILLGSKPVLIEDKINYKQKLKSSKSDFQFEKFEVRQEEVYKHTDSAYFTKYGYPLNTITSAICLDDCIKENGTLEVWPGTHVQSIKSIDTERDGPVIEDKELKGYKNIFLEAKAGSMLIWHANLVHCSHENSLSSNRRLIIMGHTSEGQMINEYYSRNNVLRFHSSPLEWEYTRLKDIGGYIDRKLL